MICYVGSSTNVKKRAISHAAQLRAGKHPNKGLNADRNKTFTFVVLEKMCGETSSEELHVKEVYYMLSMMCVGFKLYNNSPKHNGNFQELAYKYVWDLMFLDKTGKRINGIVESEYGATIQQLKIMKPKNRNRWLK